MRSTNALSLPLESELGFRVLFQNATIGIIVINQSGLIEVANPCTEKLFDYSPAELIGKPIELLMPEKYALKHSSHREKYFSQPKARPMGLGMELFARKKNGEVFPVEISLGHYEFDGDQLAVAFVTDITERVHAKKLVLEREAWFRSIADNSPVMIWVANVDKLCTYFNNTWLEFTGRTMEQEFGNGWADGVHPDDLEKCFSIYTDAFDNRRPFQMQYRLRRHDGEYRWISDSGKPTFSEEDVFMGCVGSCSDIHEQRTSHEYLESKILERTQELSNALEREKELNEMKSRFVSIASHEFRTPLSAVLSSIHLVDQYSAPEQEKNRKKHVERIKSSVKNLNDILTDFLSLEKLEQGKVQLEACRFNLKSFAEEIAEQIKGILKPGQEIKFTYAGEHEINQDRATLRNVLVNLLSNASKYSSEGEIEMKIQVLPEKINISVNDHGIGIPEDQHQLIFSRFFRGRNTNSISGTGLGLSIVKNYIELMNGKISFYSKPGEGTSFFIELPQNHDTQ